MSLFGQKTGSSLSINTTAANASGGQPAQSGGLFGGAGSNQGQSGGLFGAAQSSQPQPSGGLFSNLGTGQGQSQQSGTGLFGGATQGSQTGTGLFGNAGQTATSSQPQSGGLFSNTAQNASSTQPQSTGLFGNPGQTTTSSQPQSNGLFGNTQTTQAGSSLFSGLGQNNTSSQPQNTGGLFGGTAQSQAPKPTGLFSTTTTSQAQPPTTTQTQPSGFVGFSLGNTNPSNSSTTLFGPKLGAEPAQPNAQSSGVKIDVEHLLTTTRYEQLTDDLQKEVSTLDTFILDQINMANEVSDLLPVVAGAGNNLPNDVTFVLDKLEDLQLGLENDAQDVNNMREKVIAKDVSEARLCFRGIERLKMPPQYRQQQLHQSVSGAGAGGLSGWWNHPQTLQKSMRGATGAGRRKNLHISVDEEDEETDGPSNLVEFFERRTDEMKDNLQGYSKIMSEIESHLDGVEMTIAMKQRELRDSYSSGNTIGVGADEQVNNLRNALGVFERSIFDVADQIGATRDRVRELTLGRSGVDTRTGQSRLAW